MSIPVNYQQTLAQQTRWAARNLVYNLQFIPADKLDWKPAPTAPSAFEIVNHLAPGLIHAQRMFLGEAWDEYDKADFAPFANLADAQSRLVQIADEFAAALESLAPDALDRTIDSPYGTLTVAELLRFEPVDLVHHHGQISYIQLLLGDTEDHFDPDAT